MSKLLTTIRDLQRRKAREKRGLALAEGIRLVEEALAAQVTFTGVAVAPQLEGTERGRALKAALAKAGAPLEAVDDKTLAEVADTEHPQGVIAVIEPPAWSFADIRGAGAVLLLDGVQDPGNVGTILRSALALGAAGVVALPGTADLHNPKVLRGSMGSAFTLPNFHATDAEALAWRTAAHRPLWSTAMGGADIRAVPRSANAPAVILGNEGAGVRKELESHAERSVSIPIAAGAESLNVAAAAAILLWECTRAR